MAYVVSVKRSARQASAAAGDWVNREGEYRAFASRRRAREWAAALDCDRTVWVQDAVPNDESRADGYVVARRVEYWVSRDEEPPGEQSTLAATD